MLLIACQNKRHEGLSVLVVCFYAEQMKETIL